MTLQAIANFSKTITIIHESILFNRNKLQPSTVLCIVSKICFSLERFLHID